MSKPLTDADAFTSPVVVPEGMDSRDDAAGDVERIAQALANRTAHLNIHSAKHDTPNTFTGKQTINGALEVNGAADIDGGISTAGIAATGAVTAASLVTPGSASLGSATVTGNATVNGTLTANGELKCNGPVTITGSNDLTVTDDITCGDLNVIDLVTVGAEDIGGGRIHILSGEVEYYTPGNPPTARRRYWRDIPCSRWQAGGPTAMSGGEYRTQNLTSFCHFKLPAGSRVLQAQVAARTEAPSATNRILMCQRSRPMSWSSPARAVLNVGPNDPKPLNGNADAVVVFTVNFDTGAIAGDVADGDELFLIFMPQAVDDFIVKTRIEIMDPGPRLVP